MRGAGSASAIGAAARAHGAGRWRGEGVICTLFVPISDDDAENRMSAGLKLTVLEPLLPVVTVDDATWRIASDAQTPQRLDYLDERFQRAEAD